MYLESADLGRVRARGGGTLSKIEESRSQRGYLPNRTLMC